MLDLDMELLESGYDLDWENITGFLPLDAAMREWKLIWRKEVSGTDSVTLYDDHSEALHQWRYLPSLGEVTEVCRELLDG